MVVPLSGPASSGGSGPSSPQNSVSSQPMSTDLSDPEISSYVEQNVKKPKKKKPQPPQPAVDATLMVELCSPGTRPCDEQKLKVKHVRDGGRTYARRHPSPDDVLSTERLPCQPSYLFQFDDHAKLEKELKEKDKKISEKDKTISEKDKIIIEKDKIISEKDQIRSEKDEKISDLRWKLEKEKGEVCTKDNLLKEKVAELEKKEGEVCTRDNLIKEKDAELANCRRNLDLCETEKRKLQEQLCDCETEKRELQEKHRASQDRISRENEQLKTELTHRDVWNQQQSFVIYSLQSQFNGCAVQFNQLSFDYQRQYAALESFHRHAHERQCELDGARRRIQALTDQLRMLQNQSMDVTQLGQNDGNQGHVNGDVAMNTMNTNSGVLANGNANNATSFVSSGNASTQAAAEVSQISVPSQTDQDLTKSDAMDEHDTSVDEQALHSGNRDVHTCLETEPDSVISPSAGVEQVSSRENDANTISIQVGTLTVPLRYS